MATFSGDDDLTNAEFRGVDLSGAQFRGVDLSGARIVGSDLTGLVIRGVDATKIEIDSPWIFDGGNVLLVNGVDVLPFVAEELNRRFPGRGQARADDPERLRSAFAALHRAWAPVVERAEAMPAGTVDVSVADEWSFTQTLRHLVFATDVWLRRAVLVVEDPYHPVGLGHTSADVDRSGFVDDPSYAEVKAARAERVAMVTEFVAGVTAETLAAPHPSPWNAEYQETTLSCLHTILEEEWEHLRYAVRDLDAIEAST